MAKLNRESEEQQGEATSYIKGSPHKSAKADFQLKLCSQKAELHNIFKE